MSWCIAGVLFGMMLVHYRLVSNVLEKSSIDHTVLLWRFKNLFTWRFTTWMLSCCTFHFLLALELGSTILFVIHSLYVFATCIKIVIFFFNISHNPQHFIFSCSVYSSFSNLVSSVSKFFLSSGTSFLSGNTGMTWEHPRKRTVNFELGWKLHVLSFSFCVDWPFSTEGLHWRRKPAFPKTGPLSRGVFMTHIHSKQFWCGMYSDKIDRWRLKNGSACKKDGRSTWRFPITIGTSWLPSGLPCSVSQLCNTKVHCIQVYDDRNWMLMPENRPSIISDNYPQLLLVKGCW